MTQAPEANGGGADDEPVPKLPRGRGFKLSTQMLVRIAGTLALLVMIVLMQKPCANAVSKFVTGFGDQGSGGSAMPRPGTVDVPATAGSADRYDGYEHIGSNMTEADIKAAVERAKAKARADTAAHAGSAAPGSGAGSGAGPGAATGSGSGAVPGSGTATGSGTAAGAAR